MTLQRTCRTFITFLFFLISISLLQTSQAHTDHQEIQVISTLVVNQQKQLSEIRMVWRYDTFSSDDMLQHESDLNRLAKTLMSDIARFNYFTRLQSGKHRIQVHSVGRFAVNKVTDRDNNPALALSFTLALKKPVSISDIKKLDIVHADPTNRSLFYYDRAEDVILANELTTKCGAHVKDKAAFKEGEFPQVVAVVCRAQ